MLFNDDNLKDICNVFQESYTDIIERIDIVEAIPTKLTINIVCKDLEAATVETLGNRLEGALMSVDLEEDTNIEVNLIDG